MADRAAVLTRISSKGGTEVRILHPPLEMCVNETTCRHSSARQSVRLSTGRSWVRGPLVALKCERSVGSALADAATVAGTASAEADPTKTDVDLAQVVEHGLEVPADLVRSQEST